MFQAPIAGDVELDSVPDDLAGDVVLQAPHQAFNHGGLEFADVSARDADGVVVVLNAGQTVPGIAFPEIQPAYYADLHEKLERPEDCRPAHTRQFVGDLLSREAFLLPVHDADYGAPSGQWTGSRGPRWPPECLSGKVGALSSCLIKVHGEFVGA